MENNKNFILAVALSIAVLVGWQYLYMGPAQKARQQQAAETLSKSQSQPAGTESVTPSAPIVAPTPAGQAAVTPNASFVSRETAIAASPRVKIDGPAVKGSINLKGGRIDDLVLKDYTVTVDPDSPKVVLFSPSGSPDPFFAFTGWYASEPGVAVPGDNTLWEQEGSGPLTAISPVVLRWDNGGGLIFRRKISVDTHYMFSVADEVENKTGQPVTLRPWGQVARLTQPQALLGYSVLHEGLIGVLGASGLKELTYPNAIKNLDPATGAVKETISDKGGWLGFTDQYWAAVLIPDQSKAYDARMFGNERKQFYVDFIEKPVTLEPWSKSYKHEYDVRRREGG